MSDNNEASSQFTGMRGVFNDLRLLLSDLLGLGKPDAEQQMLIEVFFGAMGYLAKADRLVSSHETNLANLVMDELNLSMEARRIAQEAFDRGMRKDVNLDAELLRFTDVFPVGSTQTERLHDVLIRLVAADARLAPGEMDMMSRITETLGLPTQTLERKLAQLNLKR